jgi:hypothetical protein
MSMSRCKEAASQEYKTSAGLDTPQKQAGVPVKQAR